MRKNLRVVQINGFRGLLMAMFIVSCLIAGFIVFPSFVSMNVWNFLSTKTGSFPTITFYEGLLLWAIIVFSAYIFNKRKFIVSFNTPQELTDDEVKDVISRFKAQSFNSSIVPQDEFTLSKDKEDETKDLQSNSKDNL